MCFFPIDGRFKIKFKDLFSGKKWLRNQYKLHVGQVERKWQDPFKPKCLWYSELFLSLLPVMLCILSASDSVVFIVGLYILLITLSHVGGHFHIIAQHRWKFI